MDAILHYRQLHCIPELSGCEFRTAEYLERELQRMGYATRKIGNTGIVADLVSDPDLPWLLLRADMDALPVQENSPASITSKFAGVMHACGHDAHCAMLLNAAEKLIGKVLPQNLRFVFQPAEETTQGASMMIGQGVIPQNLLACFAVHVWPGLERGVVFTRPGPLMASSDVFRIHIKGRKAHCAQSYLGADALQTAVAITAELPSMKQTAEDTRCILFCGSIHSGSSHNIVPDEANLWGTLRTYSASDRRNIKGILEERANLSGQQYGTEVSLRWDGGCPAVSNDSRVVNQLRRILPTLCTDTEPTLAAEDFAYYQEYAPGVMLWLGTGNTPPLHNEAFYVPEDILKDGVASWLEIAQCDWTNM